MNGGQGGRRAQRHSRRGVRPLQSSGDPAGQRRRSLHRDHRFACATDRANVSIRLDPRYPQAKRTDRGRPPRRNGEACHADPQTPKEPSGKRTATVTRPPSQWAIQLSSFSRPRFPKGQLNRWQPCRKFGSLALCRSLNSRRREVEWKTGLHDGTNEPMPLPGSKQEVKHPKSVSRFIV